MTRKTVYSIFVIIVCIALLFAGCVKEPASTTPTESSYTEVTGPDEFRFVVVGKTSFDDVVDAMPDIYAGNMMTDGAFLEYQRQDGNYIRISFQGTARENMLVSAIEEVAVSVKDMKKSYKLEDFASIVEGKSTILDVCTIAYVETLAATSYGFLCELPLEDGRYIQIAFSNEEIVRSIQVVEEATFKDAIPIAPDPATP